MSLRLSYQKIFSFSNYLIISRNQLYGKTVLTKSLLNVNQSKNVNKIHTSAFHWDLMEFFDDEKNWGEREVKVGRSWRVEELRIKSNSDLHKLWYVLLKEKNMLLTMEHECKQKYVAFPNPERIDKVKESMENLEKVIRERNRAYYLLETGETGERPICKEVNCFGIPYKYKMREHSIQKKYNNKFKALYKLYNKTNDHYYINNFLIKLEEKKQKRVNAIKRKHFSLVCELLKRFPNVDVEALKENFPDVDIDKAKKDPNSRTHGINEF